MGEALIQGLLTAKVFHKSEIRVVDPDGARRGLFEKQYGICAAEKIPDAAVYLLAMKPQDMGCALEGIREVLPKESLIVSIAAGISTGWILSRLGKDRKVIRAMPNAAALVQQSATGIYFTPQVGPRDRETVRNIFEAVGITVVAEKEEQLDAITGLSGSGPGYVFVLLEAFADAGVCAGLSRDTASRLALQTFLGSAVMARETGKPFSLLKEVIMSPGGTTAAGLKVLEEYSVRGAILNAVQAAADRAGELSK
jgi:pyrroline-5-carboxylate reductase